MRGVLCAASILAGLLGQAGDSLAGDLSPVGFWRTFDDKTGKESGIVEITRVQDSLEGKVVKIIPEPGDPPNPVCEKCDGPEKDQPVLGLKILKGFHQDGDSWDDGTVLDPRTGNVYSAEMHVGEDGRKLFLRGYLGISLLGRTQTWLRAR